MHIKSSKDIHNTLLRDNYRAIRESGANSGGRQNQAHSDVGAVGWTKNKLELGDAKHRKATGVYCIATEELYNFNI